MEIGIGVSLAKLISLGYQVEYYIWVGDSIIRGNSTPQVAGPTPILGTVKEYNLSLVVDITDSDLALAEGGSLWPKHGIDRNASAGKIVVYINCAQGGSTITDKENSGRIWSSTAPGSLRANALTKVAGFVAAMPNAVLRAVGISGGVNDGREPVKPTAAEFKTAYQDLIDWVRTQWSPPEIWLLQTVRSDSESLLLCDFRKKVLELEADNADVHVVHNSLGFYAQNLVSTDNVHFIQDGNNKGGEQINRYQSTFGSKRLRRLFSSFHTPINALHRNAWKLFFEACGDHGNLTATEFLQLYVATTDLNRKMEIMGTGIPQQDLASHVANSHVATNGSSTFIGAGYVPATDRINATQDDIIFGVKVKTISTPGTTTAGVFGTQAASQFYLLQGSAGMQYRVNDGSATTWNGKQKPSDNSVIAIGRNGTTKFLMENEVQVHSAVVASVSTPGRPVSIGARNLNFGSNDLFCAGEFEASFAGPWSGFGDYSLFLSDLNTLLATLKS